VARIKDLVMRTCVSGRVTSRTTAEKTVDARELAGRRDSSRSNDNMYWPTILKCSTTFGYIKNYASREWQRESMRV